MVEYMRVCDDKDPTFDGLEKKCNELAKTGWQVLTIDSGEIHRRATLVREITPEYLEAISPMIVPALGAPLPKVKKNVKQK